MTTFRSGQAIKSGVTYRSGKDGYAEEVGRGGRTASEIDEDRRRETANTVLRNIRDRSGVGIMSVAPGGATDFFGDPGVQSNQLGIAGLDRNLQTAFPPTTNSPEFSRMGLLRNDIMNLNISPDRPGGFTAGLGTAPGGLFTGIMGLISPESILPGNISSRHFYANRGPDARKTAKQRLRSFYEPVYRDRQGNMILREDLRAGDLTIRGPVEEMPDDMYEAMRAGRTGGEKVDAFVAGMIPGTVPDNLYIKGLNYNQLEPLTYMPTEEEIDAALLEVLPDEAFFDQEAINRDNEARDERDAERKRLEYLELLRRQRLDALLESPPPAEEPQGTGFFINTRDDEGNILYLNNPEDAQRNLDIIDQYNKDLLGSDILLTEEDVMPLPQPPGDPLPRLPFP